MTEDFTRTLGLRVKTLRTQQGYTQDRLCAKLQLLGCDFTRSALAKVEVGQRRLYPEELRALKQALQISYEDLLE
ncbi:helix-turn-helix transcriptional regulator [Bengtsoniella intestinalis]|uniref:helix-turn-helix domain-containing protein n=1 Tax=Bengtsoniella intestinalis TaxID=3073143 RepID=UPI00391FC4B3